MVKSCQSLIVKKKNFLKDLGLGYVSIHACKYVCVLFWKEFVDFQVYPICGESRWKGEKDYAQGIEVFSN